MFDSRRELQDKILLGEDAFLELKDVWPSLSRLIRFDEQPVHGASFTDLDPAHVERFRVDGAPDAPETLARKLGMLAKSDGGERHPTVAGILMAANEPQSWLPHARIKAVAYRGRTVASYSESQSNQHDARDITGTLDLQIADACKFIAQNQKVCARKALGRFDQPQYDMTSVFEAVVNAVAHRNYSMRGARIRLHMFSNRIELYSPGGLPDTMTVDDLAYRQASRNETLTSLLAKCPVPTNIPGLDTPRRTLMDRSGSGVPVILQRSRRQSGVRPAYELLGDAELRVTIFAAGQNADY